MGEGYRRSAWIRTVVGLVLLLTAAGATARDRVVPLHPALGDTVDAAEAARWHVYPDLEGLRSVVFLRTEAGGVIARIRVDGSDGPAVHERSVPAAHWRAWRGDVAAGRDLQVFAPPSPGAVWPERPLPPLPPTPSTRPAPPTRRDLAGDWVLHLDVGWKTSATDFGDYFTDMAMFQIDVGYAVSATWTPFFGFQGGFGDLVDDFEDRVGDGKSAVYAVELGMRSTLPLSDRTAVSVAVAGGYYMRSLRWGEELVSTIYGVAQVPALVRELSDWGGSVRLGFQRRLGAPSASPVFLQAGLRLEAYGADPSLLYDPVSDQEIRVQDHDRWWALAVGLVLEL